MYLKYYILLAIEASLAMGYICPYNMATPHYERIQVRKPTCGCDQLILPPKSIELPEGLGFGPSAIAAVENAYDLKFFVNEGPYYEISEAYVPVSSPWSGVKLTTPLPPEIECLAHPVLL